MCIRDSTATEYGCLIDGGYVVFNDTDAGGDTEVCVMRIAEPQPVGLPSVYDHPQLIQLRQQQGVRIILTSQPVICSIRDAVGRVIWTARVDGAMELPSFGHGWQILEARSGDRKEVQRLFGS